MTQIKQLEDLQDFATYKLDLAKSLARVGKVPAPVLFVKKFQFNTKTAPMVLVGPLDTKFKAALVQQKIPMKLGKCVRRDDDKIVLDALNAIEVNAAFEAAAVKDQIDPNGNFEDTGMGKVANLLDKHLQDSGRATGDQDKRDQMAGKILQGMEKATNERNKAIDPSKPESHHVSAHGPGTDQVTRLVSGRRSDEVQDENAKNKTPSGTVKLSGNTHGVPDQDMPLYDKAGQNPSNRSGAFSSNTAMLHALEEAYAQATQLDTHLSDMLKSAVKANNAVILKKPEVAEALDKVQNARKAAQLVAAQLKKPGLQHTQVQQLKQQVDTLTKKAEQLADAFRKTFKEHGGDALPKLEEMNVGKARLVRNVDPGTGEGFMPDGLGVGYEAVGVDKQKKGGQIATGGKSKEQVMQERFESIQEVKGQNTARVVMDPAYVKDEKGNLRRAGWDVQTAFPQGGPGQASFNDPKVARKFIEANKDITTTEQELVEVMKTLKQRQTALQVAQKTHNGSLGSYKTKKKQVLPPLEEQLKNAGENPDPVLRKKVDQLKEAIAQLKKDIPDQELLVNKAQEAFNETNQQKVKLEEKLKKLREEVSGSDD